LYEIKFEQSNHTYLYKVLDSWTEFADADTRLCCCLAAPLIWKNKKRVRRRRRRRRMRNELNNF